MEISGSRILVTGGARGLGRTFDLDLAAADARVGGCDVDTDGRAGLQRAASEQGLQVWTHLADVSDEAAVAQAGVHAFEILHKDPWVAFPGNIQGRHIRETGPKGCLLVTVEDCDVVSVERRDLDVLRWHLCDIDVSGAVATAAKAELPRDPAWIVQNSPATATIHSVRSISVRNDAFTFR